jgi:3-phosphoglycerate kinase
MANGIADRVVTIGVVANVFLAAQGVAIGKPSADLITHLGYDAQIEIDIAGAVLRLRGPVDEGSLCSVLRALRQIT